MHKTYFIPQSQLEDKVDPLLYRVNNFSSGSTKGLYSKPVFNSHVLLGEGPWHIAFNISKSQICFIQMGIMIPTFRNHCIIAGNSRKWVTQYLAHYNRICLVVTTSLSRQELHQNLVRFWHFCLPHRIRVMNLVFLMHRLSSITSNGILCAIEMPSSVPNCFSCLMKVELKKKMKTFILQS